MKITERGTGDVAKIYAGLALAQRLWVWQTTLDVDACILAYLHLYVQHLPGGVVRQDLEDNQFLGDVFGGDSAGFW